ncbi:MAG: nucleoside deaminase [Candidatus Saccharimonadales bacterium]
MRDDKYFLKQAIKIGQKGKISGISHVEFGAVVVKNGKIIAKDFSHTHQKNDPTAHAETSAIRKACKKLANHKLHGCTLYGSHEPCLMCFSCAAWAEMDRVVYAQSASEINNFTYEFEGLKLEDLAKTLARRPVEVEHIKL